MLLTLSGLKIFQTFRRRPFVPSRNFCHPAPACYNFYPAPQCNGGYDKLNLGERRTQADGGLNDILSNNNPIDLYSVIDKLDWKFC